MGLDEGGDYSNAIIKICLAFIIGLVILTSVYSSAVSTTNDATTTAVISIQGQPADGDTITFDDSVLEFDSNGSVANGNVAVTFGDTFDTTVSNLETSINNNTDCVVI
jgi:hypothetical protein